MSEPEFHALLHVTENERTFDCGCRLFRTGTTNEHKNVALKLCRLHRSAEKLYECVGRVIREEGFRKVVAAYDHHAYNQFAVAFDACADPSLEDAYERLLRLIGQKEQPDEAELVDACNDFNNAVKGKFPKANILLIKKAS